MLIAVVGETEPQLEQALRRGGGRVAVFATLETLLSTREEVGVIVLDVRRAGSLPPALAAARQHLPAVPVVLIADGLDPMLMLNAMRAGVSEYVSDASKHDELQAALARVMATKAAEPGDVFALVGAKGGVGTTTLAVNVAAALAAAGGDRTLLVDLHLTGGDAAVFFGEEPRFTVADAIEHAHRLDAAMFRSLVAPTKTAGLDLLGSAQRPLSTPADAGRVAALLRFAASQYRHTIVDVPRTDTAVLDGLESATRIILVSNQEVAAVRNAVRAATSLRRRYGADRVCVVVTRYDPNAEIGQEEVERVVGVPVRHLFPSDYRTALQALNHGRPLVNEPSKLGAALRRFALELTGTPPSRRPAAARRSGFAAGLFRRTAPRTT